MKNKVVNSRIRCLIAFCIPVLIICICFICLGITPFGDKTVLIWDAKLQHSARTNRNPYQKHTAIHPLCQTQSHPQASP